MNLAHAELLRSIGISIDEAEIDHPSPTTRSPSPTLPHRPHHYDRNGLPVYTSEQLLWADPAQFGYTGPFTVIEQEETSHPFALNYADEVLLPKKRPVHRYLRKERFRFILGQLMGCSGHVPAQVLNAMNAAHLRTLPADQVWDAVRSVLKTHNWRLYYNRIPAILAGLGLSPFRYSRTDKFQDILHDFDKMDQIFDSLKSSLGRTYFPNLRFVAVKLMARHGLQPIVPIPLARTARKLQALQETYDLIWKAVEDKQFTDFFENLFAFQ